jgi:hypothetical protein
MKPLLTVGWREFLDIPSLGLKDIKAKVDTGARTSSLHAFDIEFYKRGGKEFVKFKVHPEQESSKKTVTCKTLVIDYRKVKSSNGQTERRPVIIASIELFGLEWPIEVTLTNRDQMGFRMLLGRQALKNRLLVDCRQSYLSRKFRRKKLKK